MPTLQDRLDHLLVEIDQLRSGRPVTLVAVSKTKPLSMLLEAYQAGQRHFGENKVQEAQLKRPNIPEDAVLHLIGPLQKNKAKSCPPLFQWLHSLDRFDVAEKLNEKYEQAGLDLEVLVQVNLSGEETKSGLPGPESVQRFCESILPFERLKLRGLMTIGDPSLDESGNRRLFAQLRRLNEEIGQSLGITNTMEHLSMGMSHDWRWAIAEGATMLRVGSTIFGGRVPL